MAAATWSSEAYPVAQRFDAWADVLSRTFLPWQITSRARPDVRAAVRERSFDGYSFLHCRCDSLSGRRSLPQLARTQAEFLCLLHIVDGTETIRIDGQEVVLQAGDSLLWDSRHRMDFHLDGTLEKLTLLVPMERSQAVSTLFPELIGRPIDGAQGIGALFAAYMRSFGREVWSMEPDAASSAVQATLELLLSTLRDRSAGGRPQGRSATLLRLQRFIRANLADPDLTPQRVAEANGLSLRYLHLLFAETGTSVGQWIRRQRIECAKADLRARGGAQAPITEIALRWGFNDVSHFGKVFRSETGLSPRDYRRLPVC